MFEDDLHADEVMEERNALLEPGCEDFDVREVRDEMVHLRPF